MLYSNYKNTVINDYKRTLRDYNMSYDGMQRNMQGLYGCRKSCAELIFHVEELVNSIANSPKHFEKAFQNVHMEKRLFCQAEEYGREACRKAAESGICIAAGVAGGAAVAALAPSAVMWAATTFGTASTGTAISALCGAASTNAALAWLGGGALSAGGAGMAGGQALLALAGPIGWGIAGSCVIVSAAAMGCKNKKIAEEAAGELRKIHWAKGEVLKADLQIRALKKENLYLFRKLKELYMLLVQYGNGDFREFDESVRFRMGTMVNNTISLSALMNRTV